MIRKGTIILVAITVVSGCDAVKQLFGEVFVSVENLATLEGERMNGIAILANGEMRFTLDYAQKKTFTVNGRETGSIRVVARHSALVSDVTFTVVVPGNEGGSAELLLSTEKFLGEDRVVMNCPGCGSIFGQSDAAQQEVSNNPIR